MSPLRARVQNGRLHLDEPTGLSDGTELELVVDDHGDDPTDPAFESTTGKELWSVDPGATATMQPMSHLGL
jgi:hypothetical protein